MPLPPSSLTSLTLSVSSTALTSPLTYDIPLSSVKMDSNFIQIPPTSSIVNAFNTQPTGTTFSYSLNASYAGGLTTVVKDGLSSIIPRKPIITPVITLENMIKSTISSPFILQPTFTNRGVGVVSFTSSNSSVATVNSSSGLVTILGQGTTQISVLLAAAEDGTYLYAPASTTATLLVPPPQWTGLGKDIDGETGGDNSGYSVSVSGDGSRVAIGAVGNGDNGSYSGQVRVYQYNQNKTVAQLDPSKPGYGPVGWDLLGKDIDGETGGDNSGYSVSLSSDGSRVAIGAPYNGGGSASGHVRVYQYNQNKTVAQLDPSKPGYGPVGWDLLGKDIDGEAAGNQSGYSVSLSSDGSRVAIGAPYNGDNGSGSGHVRVYQYNQNKTVAQPNQNLPNFGPVGWDLLGKDIDGEAAGNQSGYSVSLSSDGSRVAIGAVGNGDNGSNSGQVRVYQYNQNKTVAQPYQNLPNFGPVGWDLLGEDIDGEAAFNKSGYSVSLSSDGSRVAIGAPFNNDNGTISGQVRVYQYNADKTTANSLGPVGWDLLGKDIDGEAAGNLSGYSVSLSSDGSRVAIGAPGNGDNGSGSGQVRVYQYNADKTVAQLDPSKPGYGPVGWDLLGKDIDGEAAGNQSGYSVSLSSDGSRVAIGAPYNGDNGSGSGQVRVYELL
jgi:hypothetical protein